jgi:D-arabinose 1-dehydrogenase-like Zn-dependent alcohol dehydrogenase
MRGGKKTPTPNSIMPSIRTQGVLVTAVSPKAFQRAMDKARRGGTVSLNGLLPDDFPHPYA